VFVDWERLLRRPAPAAVPPRSSRRASVFILAFLVYDVTVSFVPRLDQRLRTYPFTGFPMFASIRARAPYDEHAPYSFGSGHFELVASDYVPEEVELTLDRYYAKLFRLRDREALHARMRDVLTNAVRLHPGTTAVRLYYTLVEAPAYPEPARIERRLVALLGELTVDGTFRSMLGAPHAGRLQFVAADQVYVIDDGAQRWLVYQLR